ASIFANQDFTVILNNPKGEKVFGKNIKADLWGGVSGEYTLGDNAALGMYSVYIPNYGSGTFRVEEYKKPEFEVKVEAPPEPVVLGDSLTAKIKANYYFGAPVTEAKVTYKVLRYSHSAVWYPPGPWDWLYGPGYWWSAYDYEWYPGWAKWGCFRPFPWWWHRPSPPPEIVMENEVKIGHDGTVDIVIDTSTAKAFHGDTDHRYEITAEVVDLSRRTITGTGSVLAARKPFSVYARVDRGYYHTGDTIKARFN
ncbi:MAG: alpha-2-macroglobulin, partial [bacterium]|nr:alpha-2-macroglobulin [bacterium]